MSFNKIDSFITEVLKVLVIVLISIATISVIAQIFFRYVIKFPALWTEALARYTMIWFTFFGGALAIKRNAHISLTLLSNRLRYEMKDLLYIFVRVTELFYLLLIMFSLFKVNQMTGRFSASSLQIPMYIINYGILFGITLMVYEINVVIIKRSKKLKNKGGKIT